MTGFATQFNGARAIPARLTAPEAPGVPARASTRRLARAARPAPAAPKGPAATVAPGLSLDAVDAGHRPPGRPAAPARAQASAPDRGIGPSDRDRRLPDPAADGPEIDLGFADFLDLVNPLQHIPIVSSIYRAITGDEISAPVRIAGGMLFGGPIGFVAGIANAIIEEVSGEDVGETAIAALVGGESPPAAPGDTPVVAALDGAGSADPPAPAPAQEAPMRSGTAALEALGRDLRGRAGPAAAAGAPTTDFAARMLDGLDKYRVLARERTRESEQIGQAFDGAY